MDEDWAGGQLAKLIFRANKGSNAFSLTTPWNGWWMVAPGTEGEPYESGCEYNTDFVIGNLGHGRDWQVVSRSTTTPVTIVCQGAVLQIEGGLEAFPNAVGVGLFRSSEDAGQRAPKRLDRQLGEAAILVHRALSRRRRATSPTTLKAAIAQVQRLEPFNPPRELLDLARRAVAERPTRQDEDVEEWARRLSREAREPLD